MPEKAKALTEQEIFDCLIDINKQNAYLVYLIKKINPYIKNFDFMFSHLCNLDKRVSHHLLVMALEGAEKNRMSMEEK